MLDGSGIIGTYFHYSMVGCLCLSALLVFIVAWKKGNLQFDESPKFTLFEEDQ